MPTLTTSGSPTFNGDSSCTIDSTGSDLVRAPSTLLSAVTGWWAMRFQATWASTDTTNRRFFTWGADTNNELLLEWTTAGATVGQGRDAGGGGPEVTLATGVFSSGSDHTVIGIWTSADVRVSWDGSTPSTATLANSLSLVGPPSLFDIGVRAYTPANWIGAPVWWAAAGTGTPSDTDATTLHGFGNTDPTFAALPASPVFLWKADDTTYEDGAAAPDAVTARDFSGHTFGPF